jgi:hypothetical protein
MAEERDPFPTEDPREKGASDQNTEENPGAGSPAESRPDRGRSPDAPGTSHDEEGDPGHATGNPGAAG